MFPFTAHSLNSARRRRTPTVLQMEAVECGAASLAMILGYYGRFVTLEELRTTCGVSRDGSNANNIVKAARSYGMEAKGLRMDPDGLRDIALPAIVFWNFNHFVVVESFGRDVVYLNDPGTGPRTVTPQEFDESFTGIVLAITPGPGFQPGGRKPSLWPGLKTRLAPSREALAFIVIAGLALVGPGLIIPTFSRLFVDEYLVNGMTDWIRPLLLGMALTAVLRASLSSLQKYYLNRLETKLSIVGAGRFLWHALSLPVEFYTQRFCGDIAQRVGINQRLAHLISYDLTRAAVDLMMGIFYAGLMMTIDVRLTLVALAAAGINYAAARSIQRRRVDGSLRLAREQGKLMGVAMGGLQAIETLKASGSESDFFGTWAGHQAKLVSYQQQLQSVTLPFLQIPVLLEALTTAAILGFGGWRVMHGGLTLGLLVAFQSLAASLMEPVDRCVTLMGTLQETEGDINRLDDVLTYPEDPVMTHGVSSGLNAERRKNLEAPFKLAGNVELKDVTFGYSRLALPLIEHFNLTLRPGHRVALVGPSGCGKSTVGKLITGLYRPWSGEVLFDSRLREEIRRLTLADSIALVDQEIILFAGTIRDNLTLWDTTVPEAQIIQACKDACIHDDIAARPRGYDGILEEGGINLSGGQRQRLEIARALVLNPRVLVLDEATSALDPATEQAIDENLRRRGCTCIISAHRLSTIRDADEILVMNQGKVVQRGTHDQLRSQEGLYASLTNA